MLLYGHIHASEDAMTRSESNLYCRGTQFVILWLWSTHISIEKFQLDLNKLTIYGELQSPTNLIAPANISRL